jgi:sugar lactone lactonase YvrE
VVIDTTSPPHIVRRIDLDAIGAQFPNDVATHPGDGDLYVSDTLRNAIYKIDRKTLTPSVFLESPALESPNGLIFDKDRGKLLVASYGPGLDPATFRTTSPGRILEVDLETKAIAPFRDMAPTGGLDGIEWYGRHLLVTDNPGGRLLEVAEDGTVSELAKDLTNPADLGVFRPANDIAIPLLRANSVRFLRLAPPN